MTRVKRPLWLTKSLGLIAGLAVVFSALPVLAGAPAVVVRLAPLAQWQQNAAFLADMLKEHPSSVRIQMLVGLLDAVGKNGVDPTRPMGLACLVGEQGNPILVGCIPTSNLDQLHTFAKDWISEPTLISDNVYHVKVRDRELYVRLYDAWVVVSHNAEILSSLSGDPAMWLAEFDSSMDVSIAINPRELASLRGVFRNWLERQEALAAMLSRIEVSQEVRQSVLRPLLETAKEAVQQTEKVILSYRIDRNEKKLVGNCTWTAKAGSDLAAQFAQERLVTSPLVAIRLWNDTAMTMAWSVTFPPPSEEDLERIGSLIQSRWDKQIERRISNSVDAQVAKNLAHDFLGLLGDWAREGKADGIVTLVTKPDQVTLLIGGYVGNSTGLEAWVGNVVESAQQRAPKAFERVTIIPDHTLHGDASIHLMRIALGDRLSPEQKAVLGDDLEVAFTATNGYAAVAIGKNPVGVIKRAIDDAVSQGDQTAPAFELCLKVDDLVATAAKLNPQDSRLQTLKANLEQCEGVQLLRKKVDFTSQQMVVDFEMDLNWLRLLKR